MPTMTIKSDKPMVLVPLDEFDSMRETIEILSDRSLMNDIKRTIKEHVEGKSLDFEEFWSREMSDS